MVKKLMTFKTKGMNKDLSVSAFNPEFSFENRNIRLSTKEDNTLMSWVNERGTALISLDSDEEWDVSNIVGTPVGTAVMGNQLILFTHEISNSEYSDHIYLIVYTEPKALSMKCKELFNGNLEFDTKYPIETLTSYESDLVQKVYWVDGKNQPRVINIKTPRSNYYNGEHPINSAFDFVRELQLKEKVRVVKRFNPSGKFPAGVIQYAFTYYNRYGQESNIFYTTPLYYISHVDRGGSPEETIQNAFKIYIDNLDTNFEYLRVYSILRTSLDATPIVKRVIDIKIPKESDLEESSLEEPVLEETSLQTSSSIQNSNILFEEQTKPYPIEFNLDGAEVLVRTADNEQFTSLEEFSDYKTVAVRGQSYKVESHYLNEYGDETGYGLMYSPKKQDDQEIVYSFKKRDFPNLVIKVERTNIADYYTWSDESDGNKDATIHIFFDKGFSRSVYFQIDSDNIGITTHEESLGAIISEQKDSQDSQNNQDRWHLIRLKTGEEIEEIEEIEQDYATQEKYMIIDTNTTGEVVDPNHLIYLNNEEFVAKTIGEKSNTLFLGNIELNPLHTSVDKDIKKSILKETGVLDDDYSPSINYPLASNSIDCVTTRRYFKLVSKGGEDSIGYINTLSPSTEEEYQGASCFKNNEYYRLGIQFQYKTGRWSEPCWVGDKQWKLKEAISDHWGPRSDENKGVLALPEFEYTISSEIQEKLYQWGYRRMRAVYAQPTASDRTILCQGIICPTMYRPCDRGYTKNNNKYGNGMYAQSSWLYRTKWDESTGEYEGACDDSGGGAVSFNSFLSIFGKSVSRDNGKTATVNSKESVSKGVMSYYRSTEVMGYYDAYEQFYIDPRFITVNSPDIEFDTGYYSFDFSGVSFYLVGNSKMKSTYGDIKIQTSSTTISPDAIGFVHNSIITYGTSALISGNYFEDGIVSTYKEEDSSNIKYRVLSYESENNHHLRNVGNFLWPVYMWHRKGSLNNDINRDNSSSVLKKKIISNYRYCSRNKYIECISGNRRHALDVKLFNNNEATQVIKVNNKIYSGCVDMVVVPSDISDFYVTGVPSPNYMRERNLNLNIEKFYNDGLGDLNNIKNLSWKTPRIKLYQPSIKDIDYSNSAYALKYDNDDKTWKWESLVLSSEYNLPEFETIAENVAGLSYFRDFVPIKYKSSPHLVMCLDAEVERSSLWNTEGWLPIIDVVIPYNKLTLYGGTSTQAMENIKWIPCGPVEDINPDSNTVVHFKWGDTYYQRFECLKTYPYTPEDINQVVEIGSFFIETRVNIDGRYDRNRGMISNLNVSPQNFNLINPVYSQQDNFFSYRIMPENYYDNNSHPNQITWSLPKQNNADVDNWTSITMASTLDLDGSLGSLNKIVKFNDKLLAFQDKGISQILYNENVQIASTEGVPIEIANSGKVQGERYFTNSVGCNNKWSIVTTPLGVYFIDSDNRSIYLFNDKLTNLSDLKGFSTWAKNNITSNYKSWTPVEFKNFVSYYDRVNQDVLFINEETALAYSEKLGSFTSFYNYEKTPYLCNIQDTGIWVKPSDDIENTTLLWKHQEGEYCKFFGNKDAPYGMILVCNPEPQTDKIFTNLEFRATVDGDGNFDPETGKFTPFLPFDYLEIWNDYQHGIAELSVKNGIEAMQHHIPDNTAHLSRKFRAWRCDIPRDNYPRDNHSNGEQENGVYRYNPNPNNRIRNHWAYIKLWKKAQNEESPLPRVEIHDATMTYFN